MPITRQKSKNNVRSILNTNQLLRSKTRGGRIRIEEPANLNSSRILKNSKNNASRIKRMCPSSLGDNPISITHTFKNQEFIIKTRSSSKLDSDNNASIDPITISSSSLDSSPSKCYTSDDLSSEIGSISSKTVSPYIWLYRLEQLSQLLSTPSQVKSRRYPKEVPTVEINIFKEAQTLLKKRSANGVTAQPTSYSNESDSDRHVIEGPPPNAVYLEGHILKPWFPSPFPGNFASFKELFICGKCFQYFSGPAPLNLHMVHCKPINPPGDEIYRKGQISFFEVDGEKHRRYCQNLCLLSKLFLDHKTVFRDVGPFLFYLLLEWNDIEWKFVGYFSKEKVSERDYNLSCLLIMPQFMQQGYGKLLIEFSYILSIREEKIGSPERPLSDLGLLAYRSYWKSVILDYVIDLNAQPSTNFNNIEKQTGNDGRLFSIKSLSYASGIRPDDLVSTMQYYGMIKYWRGHHIALIEPDMIKNYVRQKSKQKPKIDSSCLIWSPVCWALDP